ncbi:acetylornithine deacetylase [Streptomyces sp. NPDC046924]|uniref:acetylornithine deacetylase n=1 Tax=Streptomyces sp. NPDC046924 TaxID=3155136 RepID=UPI0033DDC8BF
MPSAVPVTCSDSELHSRMLDILARLVGFDTTSHRSNLPLIEYVRGLLAEHGIESRLLGNEDGTKAALVATARRSGATGPGVIWSGHTDTVPVDGQTWSGDPYTLRIEDGLALGRGTADMKGFIACALAVLTAVDREALAVPVTLLLTYDEEIGCVGARRLVPELSTWADDAVGCVVGEPTDMRVVVGHKGKQNHRVRFRGEPKHSSLAPRLPNPVVAAAALTGFAQELNERFRAEGPHDPRFPIPHSWINVGRVEGGVKPNIVPEECLLELEIRTVPGHSCDDVAAELRAHAEGELLASQRKFSEAADVRVEQLSDTPSFAVPEDHAFVGFVQSAFERPLPVQYVPFGTEAGLLWGHAGIPSVVCGPGSIDQAHTPDESVPLDDLRACLTALRSLPVT